jgi:hypothetical protein
MRAAISTSSSDTRCGAENSQIAPESSIGGPGTAIPTIDVIEPRISVAAESSLKSEPRLG